MDKNKIILYQEEDRNISVYVIYSEETFWLKQKSMAELFDVDISTINEHLKNIYKTEELEEKSTIGKFPIVQKEGNRSVTRQVKFYNLDAIIAVGYRVNSKKAKDIASKEYDIFNKTQKIDSDFDEFIKRVDNLS